MKLHFLEGFLGAGKTAAIGQLARHFRQRGERVAVVTNDQGRMLVDTEIARQSGAMVSEIGGGCLCCRYDELEDALKAAVQAGTSVALVEAVGSCTDLLATVLAPMASRLRDRVHLAPLSVLVDPWRVREMTDRAFGPDIEYLFRKQIEEADVIVLTRADCAPPDVTGIVREMNRSAAIVRFSGRTGQGISEWLAARPDRPAAPLMIDYDRYAAAEARLGWFDGRAAVRCAQPFSPAIVVRRLLEAMRDTPVAHLKVAVVHPASGTAALVRRGGTPDEELDALPAETRAMSLVVNGRVAVPPHELSALMLRALGQAAEPAEASWEQLTCFAPARPKPVHRLPDPCPCDSGDISSCCAASAPFRMTAKAPDEHDSALGAAFDGRADRTGPEAAERRSRFLAEASRALSATLDYNATLARVAELAVPVVADFCAVYIEREPDTPMHPAAVAYDDRTELDRARMFAAEYANCVARSGRSVCSVTRTRAADYMLTDEVLVPDTCERYRNLAQDLSLATIVAVPLVARERSLGVVVFAFHDRRANPRPDLALAEDLAGRAALAVDNARLYTEAQETIRLREEVIRARGEFLSVASHELRTPAQSLLLGIQMLSRLASAGKLAADAGSSQVASVLEKLDRQSRHMEQLIGRLLDVTRIQSGQFKLEVEHNVDLAEVTRDVVFSMRDLAGQKGCTIELRADEVTGDFDRTRIAQVVNNLLSNAMRYGAGAPLDVVVERVAGQARLTVRDRGVGIAPEAQALIFEAFKRAASDRHYGGLGLGLYIAKQIVSAHGGTIHVESALGAGATFLVSLPCRGALDDGGGA